MKLDSPSVWTGKASATVYMAGPSSLDCTFDGSFGFTIYLDAGDRPSPTDQKIPANTVLGRMAGAFKTELADQAGSITGSGGVSYFIGGSFDPATQTISIGANIAGMEATGRQTLPGDPASGIPPAVAPLAVNWNTGRRSPMDDSYEDLPVESVTLEPPRPPVFHPSRSGDSRLMKSVPQTGPGSEVLLKVDLRNPTPQTITYTDGDPGSPGTRVTTWTLGLVPIFTIERDDRTTEAVHSFISTDLISFHASIPGVTVQGSDWESLLSWQVSGEGPNSNGGTPSQASETSAFSFTPNPSAPPAGGSGERNRPLSYRVTAGIEGSTQHYFLAQDELDLLRQEYVDCGVQRVPARNEFVACPKDGTLNLGNYGFVERELVSALDRVKEEFKRLGGGVVEVSRGYLSPKRYALDAGGRGGGAAFGLSLNLIPRPAGQRAFELLGRACVKAECSFACEEQNGTRVPCASTTVNHLHATWPQFRTNETESISEVPKVVEGDS